MSTQQGVTRRIRRGWIVAAGALIVLVVAGVALLVAHPWSQALSPQMAACVQSDTAIKLASDVNISVYQMCENQRAEDPARFARWYGDS